MNNLKYKIIKEENKREREELKKSVSLDFHRQSFHIMGESGLINDPNGFSYFNNEIHLFFQWFPFEAIHGNKHWAHLKSKDFLNWQNLTESILIPNENYDSHGCFSGTSIEKDEKLYIFYTGNVRNERGERESSQCLAIMNKNYKIKKYEKNPIIERVAKGYTNHFRDPKVFQVGNKYYMLLGAQNKNLNGRIVVYESENLTKWNFKGELNTNFKNFGYMWECPDYFEMNGKSVLMFCPQGLESQGSNYNNIHQSGYIIGDKIDWQNLNFNGGEFIEFDRGFDFYAPQTLSFKGRKILIAWMGLPDTNYPSEKQFWSGCLTIPRELILKDNKILMKPIKELESLRGERKTLNVSLKNENLALKGFEGNVFEILMNVKDLRKVSFLEFKFRASESEKTSFIYNNKKLLLKRAKLNEERKSNIREEKREAHYSLDYIKLQVFVDKSSIEIFVNDGELVFSSRIFPSKKSNNIEIYSNGLATIEIEKYDLE